MGIFKSSASITPRDTRSFKAHLSEISNKKYDVLSIDEEVELATRSRQGDIDARNKLVEHNLRLAITIAKNYQNQGCEIEDLVAAAEIGLMDAAENFDPTIGVKFISYACHHINRSISELLTANSRTIRLPQNVVMLSRKITQTISKYQMQYNLPPTDEELARMLNEKEEDIHKIRTLIMNTISIDTPLGDDSDNTIESMIADSSVTDRDIEKETIGRMLNQLMNCLNEREAEVLKGSFGLNGQETKTTEQIANEMGLSNERIRQMKEKALLKLRNNYGTQLLQYIA